jgi:hypothetical protein
MAINAPPSSASSRPLRVTDEDRARTVTALNDAFTRGALADDEHEQRVACAWAAGYADELAALTSDLPAPSEADIRLARREVDRREWLDEWRWWCGGALVMLTIWGVQAIRSGPDFFWPLAPLAIWAAILVTEAFWRDDENG